MKTLQLLLLNLLLFAGISQAATITYSGRIEGRLAGSVLGDINYHTLDFYWFRVVEPTQVQIQWCVTNGPGGQWGTGLGIGVYPNASATADMTSIGGAVTTNNQCTTATLMLGVGNYIFDAAPGGTSWDGADGLVPFSDVNSDFFYFDYNATITGNIELYETWIGQTDKTFLVTSIPEPGVGVIIGILMCCLAMQRRRIGVVASICIFVWIGNFCSGNALAEQGTLEWRSIPGMGYGFQRSMDLGSEMSWVDLSLDTCGMGGIMKQHLFELEPPVVQPSGQAALYQRAPFYSFMITGHDDGSATIWWTDSSTGQGVGAEIAAPPPNAEHPELPPYFDVREVPGDSYSPRLSGAGIMNVPATATEGAYRLMYWVSNSGPSSIARTFPPLTAAQAQMLARLTNQIVAIRTDMFTPPPVQPLPPLRRLFDDKGNPMRDFYRLTTFPLDSDGDGYSDHDEIRNSAPGSGYAFNASVHPLDTDGDGFSNGEEVRVGTDPNDAASHPSGGFIVPYLNLNDLVITEFMVKNDGALIQEISHAPFPKNDWVEIYNPTNETKNLTGYYLTDKSNTPGKWPLTGNAHQTVTTIPPHQFVVVMIDNFAGREDAEGNGFLHASFGLGSTDNVIRLSKNDPNNAGNILTVDQYWIGSRRAEGQTTDTPVPAATVVTARDMFDHKNESYGMYVGTDGTLKRGLLRRPTPGRFNSEGYLETLPAPTFSQQGGIRTSGSLSVTLTHPFNEDSDPDNDVTILYTTNCATPTEYSEMCKTKTFTFPKTGIIRAMAVRSGWEKSPVVARSYISVESVLGTAAPGAVPTDAQTRPAGYPEDTALGSNIVITNSNPARPASKLHYDMNPQAIGGSKDGIAHRTTIAGELMNLPVLSLTLPVDDFFNRDTAGINGASDDYGHYRFVSESETHVRSPAVADPQGTDWTRAATLEWMDPTAVNAVDAYRQTPVGLELSGEASASEGYTPKHNFRVRFSKKYGASPLTFNQDPLQWDEAQYTWNGSQASGSGPGTYTELSLHQPTHSSWSSRNGYYWPFAKYGVYVQDQWMRMMFQEMAAPLSGYPETGMLRPVARERWMQVFINGLYWGPYYVGERVSEDWLNKVYGTTNVEFDIVKETGQTSAGTNLAWTELKADCLLISQILVGDAPTTTGFNFIPASAPALARSQAAAAEAGITLPTYTGGGSAYADPALALTCYNLLIPPLLDVDNYIDYLLLYHFVGERDWPHNNWTCARANNIQNVDPNRSELAQFRFFPSSSEIGLLQYDANTYTHLHTPRAIIGATAGNPGHRENYLDGLLGGTNTWWSGSDSVAFPAQWLRELPAFKTAFRERVKKHFHTPGGVFYRLTANLTTPQALPCLVQMNAAMRDFRTVWYGESARWGDLRMNPATGTPIQLGPENTATAGPSYGFSIVEHWGWLEKEWCTDPAIPRTPGTAANVSRRSEVLLDLTEYDLVYP